MTDRKDTKYIEIVQEVGETLGVGPLPVVQVVIVAGSFSIPILLSSFLNIGLFTCFLLGTWGTATGWLVVGESPYRFLNRLLSRTHDWRRGFEPSKSLIEPTQTDKK